MSQKFDARQTITKAVHSMIGDSVNDGLDSTLVKVDAELAKLFEDRNFLLADGGVITVPSAGTSITFTQALKLHVNSQVAGGTPTVIDLTSTTRTLSANLRMVYAIINRTAGTATVTDDAATLPAQTSANQEVVILAKRIDSADGTKTIYFRNGMSIIAGQSARLGSPSALDSSFTIGDATDPTKQIAFDAAGTTGTKTTITGAQTANRIQTLQDASDTFVYRGTVDQLTNKQVAYSVSTDSTTTGSNASLQAFTTGIVRLTNASLISVSGIPAGSAGQFLIIENKTGAQITINNEETTPTAANRIQTGTGTNVSMPNNATFMLAYDSTTGRWQLSGSSASTSDILKQYKNYIINGAMEVSHRNTTFTAIADAAYSLDRYQYSKVGAAVHTITQDTDVPTVASAGYTFNNSLRMNLTTPDTSIAAGDFVWLGQKIEGYNWANLAQKTFTLSFWVKATTTGTYCVAFANSAADRSYVAEYTINATATWEYKTITVSASPSAGTWNYTTGTGLRVQFILAAGSTFQTTAGTWQTGNFYATSNQVNGVNTGATDFRLTGIQIQEGSAATPFRLFSDNAADEVTSCRRYLPVITPPATSVDPLPGNASGLNTQATHIFPYLVKPRTAPTSIVVSAASHFSFSSPAGNSAASAVSIAVAGTNAVQLAWTIGSVGGTILAGWMYCNTTSARLYLEGCEL